MRYAVAVSIALAALVVLAACGPPNVAEGRPIPPKNVPTVPAPVTPSTGGSTPGTSGSSGSSSSSGQTSSSGSSGTSGSTSASAAAKLYATTCATCHGAQGQGGIGPALNTSLVTSTFTTQASLAAFIKKNMPFNNPGSLSATQSAELAAYIETLASGK